MRKKRIREKTVPNVKMEEIYEIQPRKIDKKSIKTRFISWLKDFLIDCSMIAVVLLILVIALDYITKA